MALITCKLVELDVRFEQNAGMGCSRPTLAWVPGCMASLLHAAAVGQTAGAKSRTTQPCAPAGLLVRSAYLFPNLGITTACRHRESEEQELLKSSLAFGAPPANTCQALLPGGQRS